MWMSFHWQDGQTVHLMVYDQSPTLTVSKVPAVFWNPSISSPTGFPAKTCPSPDDEPDSTETAPVCSSKPPGSSRRCAMPAEDGTQLGLSLRTSQGSSQLTEALRWGASSTSWPTAGRWESNGLCWTRSTSGCPSVDGECSSSLGGILESAVEARYFLSAKAAQGILRRANKRGRQLPPLLQQALERVAQTTTKDKPAI